jgi:hypothetical protein
MLMLKSWCTCTGAQRHHVCCVDIKLPGDKEQGGNANVSASFNMLEERIRSRRSNTKSNKVPSSRHHNKFKGKTWSMTANCRTLPQAQPRQMFSEANVDVGRNSTTGLISVFHRAPRCGEAAEKCPDCDLSAALF